MVQKSENFNNLKKSQENTFFQENFLLKKKSLKKQKKCYPLSFPILGRCDSTRALQSSLVQKYKNLEKSQKITFF